MVDSSVVCVLSDPQSRVEWVDLVREGTDVRNAVADPMGGAFSVGADDYRQTIMLLRAAYAECLGR